MTSQVRSAVLAYRAAAALGACDTPRLALATSHAAQLAEEEIAAGGKLRHTPLVAAAVEDLNRLQSVKVEPGSEEAIAHGAKLAQAADAFWSHFEGEPIEGVEILRKRA